MTSRPTARRVRRGGRRGLARGEPDRNGHLPLERQRAGGGRLRGGVPGSRGGDGGGSRRKVVSTVASGRQTCSVVNDLRRWARRARAGGAAAGLGASLNSLKNLNPASTEDQSVFTENKRSRICSPPLTFMTWHDIVRLLHCNELALAHRP